MNSNIKNHDLLALFLDFVYQTPQQKTIIYESITNK